MIMRCRAFLDGKPLDTIDNSIYIIDISENAPSLDIVNANVSANDGVRVVAYRRKTLDVKISFAVREYDVARRQTIVDNIAEWCDGKILTTSTRPGKRLRVRCTALPSVSSALKWTDTLSLTLTAFEYPFWESEFPSIAKIIGVDGDVDLAIPGNKDTLLEASIENTSESGQAFDSLKITVNDAYFEFQALGLASHETLHIAHDEKGLLKLYISAADGSERSAYRKRTYTSADELILHPGNNTITIASGRACTWIFEGRGRWK